jgi:hypothetical protein
MPCDDPIGNKTRLHIRVGTFSMFDERRRNARVFKRQKKTFSRVRVNLQAVSINADVFARDMLVT